jgi:hypothetical protein
VVDQLDDATNGAPDTAQPLPVEHYEEQVAHLLVALENRTVMGQATGIIMERFHLRSEVAFGVLLRLSQDQNVKVHTLALTLVTTGDLPGLSGRLSQSSSG